MQHGICLDEIEHAIVSLISKSDLLLFFLPLDATGTDEYRRSSSTPGAHDTKTNFRINGRTAGDSLTRGHMNQTHPCDLSFTSGRWNCVWCWLLDGRRMIVCKNNGNTEKAAAWLLSHWCHLICATKKLISPWKLKTSLFIIGHYFMTLHEDILQYDT